MAKAIPRITKAWLEERTTRSDCGCMVWNGYIAIKNGGHDSPYVRPSKDTNPMPVRRLVWRLKTGKLPRPNDRISRSCMTYGCVAPACMECSGPADKLKGISLSVAHRAKIAAALRNKGRTGLSIEKVRAIRASDETNEREAIKHGVGENTVAEIRRGTRWREYTANPWAQLSP